MAKRLGRPPKDNVARYPCGKVDLRANPLGVRDSAEWRGLQEMVKAEAVSPHWHCELYRLHHFDKITTEEREAGDEFIRLTRDIQAMIGSPIGKVSKLERGFGQFDIDVDAINHDAKDDYIKKLKRLQDRYDEAWVLGMNQGVAAMRAAKDILFDNSPLDYGSTQLARKCLKAWAVLFGFARSARKKGG